VGHERQAEQHLPVHVCCLPYRGSSIAAKSFWPIVRARPIVHLTAGRRLSWAGSVTKHQTPDKHQHDRPVAYPPGQQLTDWVRDAPGLLRKSTWETTVSERTGKCLFLDQDCRRDPRASFANRAVLDRVGSLEPNARVHCEPRATGQPTEV